jgi:hypothetical protein
VNLEKVHFLHGGSISTGAGGIGGLHILALMAFIAIVLIAVGWRR